MKRTAGIVVFLICALLIMSGCAQKTETVISIENTDKKTEQPKRVTASQTPAQTLAPTPEPTPIPSPGSEFYDSFFDNSVFIGDSITQGLQNYVTQMRKERPQILGDAKFAAAKSFNLERACAKRVPSDGALRYRGKAVTIPGIIVEMDVNTVYIMLGVNDWAGSHVKECRQLYAELLSNIKEAAPNVTICVQSCTPVTKSGEREKLNNEILDAFNESLRILCADAGAYYVDINTVLKGEDNCLKPEFSSDHYVHMSKDGAMAWVNALYQYAYDTYASGNWKPENERS